MHCVKLKYFLPEVDEKIHRILSAEEFAGIISFLVRSMVVMYSRHTLLKTLAVLDPGLSAPRRLGWACNLKWWKCLESLIKYTTLALRVVLNESTNVYGDLTE